MIKPWCNCFEGKGNRWGMKNFRVVEVDEDDVCKLCGYYAVYSETRPISEYKVEREFEPEDRYNSLYKVKGE